MIRRLNVAVLCILVLATAMSSSPARLLAQDAATPETDSTAHLFQADGISAPVMASVGVVPADIAEPRFVLERLELPTGSSLPEHTALAIELLHVETGTVTIADNFGFTSSAAAGGSLNLVQGTVYTLSNDGTEDVTVLRAGLTPGHDADSGSHVLETAAATPLADDLATPIASGVVEDATPVTADITNSVTSTFLIDLPITSLPTGESSFFLAEVTLDPGAESGEQSHAGPIALYVEQGTLVVQSPSGLSGQLDAGRAVALPENAALIASNQGADQAVAYILGWWRPATA